MPRPLRSAAGARSMGRIRAGGPSGTAGRLCTLRRSAWSGHRSPSMRRWSHRTGHGRCNSGPTTAASPVAAVGAGPRPRRRLPLAPLAPVAEIDRAQLAAARADDQPGPRQPVAAGAQPGGQVPAGLAAARAWPDRMQGAGIAAVAQPGLGAAGPGRPARGAGDHRPRGRVHTGGMDRPPRRVGWIADADAAGAGRV